MSEDTTKTEDFNPEKITKEGDDLKKAYFEATQDINKIKTEHKDKETELQKQIDELTNTFKSQQSDKEAEELKKLEADGNTKDVNAKLMEKTKGLEAEKAEIKKRLDSYEKAEAERQKIIEEKRKVLLEKLPEADRGLFKDATIELIEKFLEKEPEKRESLVGEKNNPDKLPSSKDKLATERIHETPQRSFADQIVENQWIKKRN